MERFGHKTEYNGIIFRSKLETEWAKFFDTWGLKWEYEPENYRIDGVYYQPDFVITNMNYFFQNEDKNLELRPLDAPVVIEVKPAIDLPRNERVKLYKYWGSVQTDLYFLLLVGDPLPQILELYEYDADTNIRRVYFGNFGLIKNELAFMLVYQQNQETRETKWYYSIPNPSYMSLFTYIVDMMQVVMPRGFLYWLTSGITKELTHNLLTLENVPMHEINKVGRKMIIQKTESGDYFLGCPVCKSNVDNVHPSCVKVYPVNDTEYVITNKGLEIKDSDAAQRQRGVSIVLSFFCEEGHTWKHEFKFHKGTTFIETEMTHAMTLKKDDDTEPHEIIWRS